MNERRKGKKCFIVLLGLLAFLLVATPGAQAVKVENVTQGTTIFDSGGFEHETTGASPSAPLAGFYQLNPYGSVTDNATTPVPGAFEGTKYNELGLGGLAETFFGVGTGSSRRGVPAGEVIRISWAQHVNGTPEFRMRLTGGDGGNQEAGIFDFQPTTGGVRGWSTVGGYPSYTGTKAVVLGDQWQTVVIEHEVGTNDVTVTLDGVSELFPGVVSNAVSLERIRWDNIQSGYVDAFVDNPLRIVETGASTEVFENSGSDTYEIKLVGEQTGSVVTVTVDPELPLKVNGQPAGDPVDLVFTLDPNALVDTHTVTVEADDDGLDIAMYTKNISHVASSSDPNYDGASQDLVVTVTQSECGDWGFLASDISGPLGQPDYYSDLFDFVVLAEDWLKCTDPFNPGNCVNLNP